MTPESSFQMNEMEFEKEIKGLDKKTFVEFRKKFREFSSIITKEKTARKFSVVNKTKKTDKHDKHSDRHSDKHPNNFNDEPMVGNEYNMPCLGLFSFKDQLRIISQKLHLLKREFERREVNARIQERIKDMLRTSDEMLHIDEPDFREAIHNMENKEFKQYLEKYKENFISVISNRKKIAPLNVSLNPSAHYDKEMRDNIKIIKRWDFIEEELFDRERRLSSN